MPLNDPYKPDFSKAMTPQEVGVSTGQGTFNSQSGYIPNQAISSQSLQPQQPIQPVIPTPSQPPLGVTDTLQSQIDAINKQYEVTQQEQEIGAERTRIQDLTAQLYGNQGERATRARLELDPNILAERQRVQDLTSQANALIAEAKAIPLQIQQQAQEGGANVTKGGLAPIQTAALRQNAIKALSVGSLLSASQGNLTLALDQVDRAINAEFEPRRAELEARKQNLEMMMNDPAISKENARRGEIARARLADEERRLKVEETNKEAISKLALEAARNGADSVTLQNIRNAKTPDDAIIAGGKIFADPEAELKMDLLREQIATQRQNRSNSQVDRLIEMAKLGDTKAMGQLGLTPPEPSAKVAVTQKEAAALNQQITQNDNYKAIDKSIASWRALSEYEKVVNDVGATNRIVDPLDTGKSKAVWNTALLNLKEYYNLGVLNGPDLEIMQQLVPSNVKSAIGTFVSGIPGGGIISDYITKKRVQDAITNQKIQFEDKLDTDYLSVKAQYKDYSPDQLTNLQDLDRKYLQMKATIDPSIATFLKENPDMPLDEVLQVINTRI